MHSRKVKKREMDKRRVANAINYLRRGGKFSVSGRILQRLPAVYVTAIRLVECAR